MKTIKVTASKTNLEAEVMLNMVFSVMALPNGEAGIIAPAGGILIVKESKESVINLMKEKNNDSI